MHISHAPFHTFTLPFLSLVPTPMHIHTNTDTSSSTSGPSEQQAASRGIKEMVEFLYITGLIKAEERLNLRQLASARDERILRVSARKGERGREKPGRPGSGGKTQRGCHMRIYLTLWIDLGKRHTCMQVQVNTHKVTQTSTNTRNTHRTHPCICVH